MALVWQSFFAQVFSADLLWAERMVLGLSIWLVYLGDHIFDVAKRIEKDLRFERHRWVKEHEAILRELFRVVLVVDVVSAFSLLKIGSLLMGIVLLGACLAYEKWVAPTGNVLAKGVLTAVLFAAGVFLFITDSFSNPIGWASFGLFGLLCLGNILSLASIEGRFACDDSGCLAISRYVFMGLFAFIGLFWSYSPEITLPVLISALGMVIIRTLWLSCNALNASRFYTFSDLCMLSPLIFIFS